MHNLKLGHSDSNLCVFLVSLNDEFLAGSTLFSCRSQKFRVLIYWRQAIFR